MASNNKLYVGGLSWGTDDRSLHQAFSQYGELVEAVVMKEREDPSRSRGFGFVTFKTDADALRAAQEMNDRELDGRRLRVDIQGGGKGKGGGKGDRPSGGDHYGSGGDRGGDRYGSGGDRGGDRYGSGGDRGGDRSGSGGDRGGDRYGSGGDRGGDRYGSGGDRGGDRYGSGGDRGGDRHGSGGDRGGDRYGSGGGDRYGSGSSREPEKVENTNNKIYITGLPPNVTAEEIQEKFGMIGIVARKKQKRGYPDQWPFKINIYTGADGKCKGDASLTYEDPNAAESASSFFSGSTLDNHPDFTLTVQMADVKETPESHDDYGGGGGGYGGGGGGYGKGKGKGKGGGGYGGREGGGSRGDHRSEPYNRRY